MKNCTFCAEEIQETATKCRYCGEWLEDPNIESRPRNTPASLLKPTPQASRRHPRRRAWLFSALVIGLALAAMVPVLALNRPGNKPSAVKSAPLVPPANVTAVPSPFAVTLKWVAPSSGATANAYRIYRDGVLLDEVPASATRYVDNTALPQQRYDYAIESLSAKGEASPKADVRVHTKAAPLSLARVAGRFTIDERVLSRSPGVFDSSAPVFSGYEFTPICQHGACDVEWKQFHDPGYPLIDAKLTRVNGAYQASATVAVNTCGGAGLASDILQFHIVKARTLDGDWRAKRIAGKEIYEVAAQNGCTGWQETLSMSGSLLPDEAASVVAILGRGCSGVVVGTGFLAAKGYVITNAHVVAGETSTSVKVDDAGRMLGATVVLFDPKRDIAVLRVKRLGGEVLPLSASSAQVGARADVIGFPGGNIWDLKARVLRTIAGEPRDAFGHSVRRREYRLKAQTRPGSSGSPVVLADGSVAGVIWGGTGHGFASAIASSEVIPLLDRAQGKTRAVGTGSCLP